MTVNDILADKAIRHAIWLSRFGGSASRKLVELLGEVERDLIGRIAAGVEKADLVATIQRRGRRDIDAIKTVTGGFRATVAIHIDHEAGGFDIVPR